MQMIKLSQSKHISLFGFYQKQGYFCFIHCVFSLTDLEKHADSYKEAIGRLQAKSGLVILTELLKKRDSLIKHWPFSISL